MYKNPIISITNLIYILSHFIRKTLFVLEVFVVAREVWHATYLTQPLQ
jgi:hypothetical protein